MGGGTGEGNGLCRGGQPVPSAHRAVVPGVPGVPGEAQPEPADALWHPVTTAADRPRGAEGLRRRSDDEERCARAVELAAALLEESRSYVTADERRRRKRIARLVEDEQSRAFLLELTDQVLRIRTAQRAARRGASGRSCTPTRSLRSPGRSTVERSVRARWPQGPFRPRSSLWSRLGSGASCTAWCSPPSRRRSAGTSCGAGEKGCA